MTGRAARPVVRLADVADTPVIGRLLDAFNAEYDEPTPGPAALADRVARLLEEGDTVVVLGGEGPDGLALLRFRPALWSPGLECYLAELYVRPTHRGRGLGRAIMERALVAAKERGADTMDLGTDETDTVAHHLYERLGFSRYAGGEGGPAMFVFERQL